MWPTDRAVSELYQNPICSNRRGYLVSDKQIPQVVKRPENQNEGMYWLERRRLLRRRPLYPTELRPRLILGYFHFAQHLTSIIVQRWPLSRANTRPSLGHANTLD